MQDQLGGLSRTLAVQGNSRHGNDGANHRAARRQRDPLPLAVALAPSHSGCFPESSSLIEGGTETLTFAQSALSVAFCTTTARVFSTSPCVRLICLSSTRSKQSVSLRGIATPLSYLPRRSSSVRRRRRRSNQLSIGSSAAAATAPWLWCFLFRCSPSLLSLPDREALATNVAIFNTFIDDYRHLHHLHHHLLLLVVLFLLHPSTARPHSDYGIPVVAIKSLFTSIQTSHHSPFAAAVTPTRPHRSLCLLIHSSSSRQFPFFSPLQSRPTF